MVRTCIDVRPSETRHYTFRALEHHLSASIAVQNVFGPPRNVSDHLRNDFGWSLQIRLVHPGPNYVYLFTPQLKAQIIILTLDVAGTLI
jgi:hypothetical protein